MQTTLHEIVETERQHANQYTGTVEIDVDLLRRALRDAMTLHTLLGSKFMCGECGHLNEI